MLSSVAPPTVDTKTERIIHKSIQILYEEIGTDIWSAPAKYISRTAIDFIEEKL